MHITRRALVIMLLLTVALLGWVLFANIRQTHLFSFNVMPPHTAQPPQKAAPTLAQQVQTRVSGTTLVSLSTVTTTTVLEQPHYTGQDEHGHNWQLTADTAAQAGSTASSTYVLSNVQGQWQSPSQTTPLTVRAVQGVYNAEANHINLTGNVVMTGQGLTLNAAQASASMVTRQVQAGGGVSVTGVVGGWNMHVTAPSLTAVQNNQNLTLTGGVHAILTPISASAKAR